METRHFSIKVKQTRRYGNKYSGIKTLNYAVVENKETHKKLELWIPKLDDNIDELLLKNYKW